MPWSIVSTRYTDDGTAEVLDIVCRKSNIAGVTDIYLENRNRKKYIGRCMQMVSSLGRPWTLMGEYEIDTRNPDQAKTIHPRIDGFAGRRWCIEQRLKELGLRGQV